MWDENEKQINDGLIKYSERLNEMRKSDSEWEEMLYMSTQVTLCTCIDYILQISILSWKQ